MGILQQVPSSRLEFLDILPSDTIVYVLFLIYSNLMHHKELISFPNFFLIKSSKLSTFGWLLRLFHVNFDKRLDGSAQNVSNLI